MKNLFKIFTGSSDIVAPVESRERMFIYCLIRLPIGDLVGNKSDINRLFSVVFRLIEDAGGDVNQFCCDTILSLFGVPFAGSMLYANLRSFVGEIVNVNDSLKICLGQDVGLYGSFGYEKRLVVTALGRRLVRDFHALGSMQEGEVHVHSSLSEVMGGLDGVAGVMLVD